ncbi:hypothetical protein GCM10029978_105570 [Actinoallomurus acanthiterrae]
MSEPIGKSAQSHQRELVDRFNKLIETLPTDEAVAVIAHYVLGVRYAKIASYLKVSPRKAQRLTALGMRRMRDGIRRGNLYSERPLNLWDFREPDVKQNTFVQWLADQFKVRSVWAPYRNWIIELISGVEARPCLSCGESVYRNTEQPELAPLTAELGRPRKFCSNACRQRFHWWKRYLDELTELAYPDYMDER